MGFISQCLPSFFSGHVAEKKFKQISKTVGFQMKPFLLVILWVLSDPGIPVSDLWARMSLTLTVFADLTDVTP